MNYKKPTSVRLNEGRRKMIRRLLKFVNKYEEYVGIPGSDDFTDSTKLLENIKRVGMICNQLHGLEKTIKDEEATINGFSAEYDEGVQYEEDRLAAAKEKLERLGLGTFN